MPSEIYKILNDAVDYTCLACGTYNCNSGICDRCRSIQYGSPEYVRSGLARRDRLLATLSPQQYAAYIANEQHETREKELRRIREREEDERRQARDRTAEAARLAVTLPLRARWEQQQKDELTARLRHIFKRVSIVVACVLLIAIAVCAIRLADLGAAALCSGVLGTLAAAGARFARSRRRPEAPVRPPASRSSYSRAPRSE
jgi:hypothetical protein